MSFFGVELNAQVNRLFLALRLTLSKNKCIPNLRTIYHSFIRRDSLRSGTLSPVAFESALNENGIFLKKFELQVFSKAFDREGQIDWFTFFGHLRQPLNEYRRGVLESIFQKMGGGKPKIHFTELMVKFDPSQIEEYRLGLKSRDAISKDLFDLVATTQEGYVTHEEFLAFYGDLGFNILSDETFGKFVSSHWGLPYEAPVVAEVEKIKEAIRLMRFKLIQRTEGTHEQFLLRKVFAEFDQGQKGHLTETDLATMLIKLEIPIESIYLRPLLAKLDHNKNGQVEFEEFKNFLFFDPFPI